MRNFLAYASGYKKCAASKRASDKNSLFLRLHFRLQCRTRESSLLKFNSLPGLTYAWTLSWSSYFQSREHDVPFIPILITFVALLVSLFMWSRRRQARYVVFMATFGIVLLTLLIRDQRTKSGAADALTEALPPTHSEGGYVTSTTCRACHSDQHASWQQTYHRTMTQIATPENVLAPFANALLDADGQLCRVFRRGDEFWVEMDDPEWERLVFLDQRDTRSLPRRRRAEATRRISLSEFLRKPATAFLVMGKGAQSAMTAGG